MMWPKLAHFEKKVSENTRHAANPGFFTQKFLHKNKKNFERPLVSILNTLSMEIL